MTRTEQERFERIESALQVVTGQLRAQVEYQEKLEPKLDEVIDMLTKYKGIISFIKVIFFIGTPIAGVFIYLKEHLK